MNYLNNKKGNLVGTVIVVIFAIFMFVLFSPIILEVISDITQLEIYQESPTLTLFANSVPFLAFIGIIVSIFYAFAVRQSQE